MAGGSVAGVALVAVHPGFARQIVEGRKLVEFRKVRFAQEVSHVLVYATAPVMRIVGWFEVGGIEEASPSQLWKRYARAGGVEEAVFWRYYGRAERGVAIQVDGAVALQKPITLAKAGCHGLPPQSFRYVEHRVLERVLRLADRGH